MQLARASPSAFCRQASRAVGQSVVRWKCPPPRSLACAHSLPRVALAQLERTICRNRCPLSSKRRRPPLRRGPLATPPPHTPPLRLPPHQSASCRRPYRVCPPQQPLPQQAVRRWSTRRQSLRPLRRQHWRHRRQSQRTSIPSSPLRSRRPFGSGSLGRAGHRTSPSSLHSSSAPGRPTSRVRPSTRLVMWTFTPCGRRGEHASHVHIPPGHAHAKHARTHAAPLRRAITGERR